MLLGGLAFGVGCGGPSSGSTASGNRTTGDSLSLSGDGDPSSDGDGDGDPSTGDGDPTTSTGDGDPSTGDGDGDPVKFDLPTLPDAGGGPILPAIPETCEQALQIESTVGCQFRANKMQNFIEEPTSLVVGNVSDADVATIEVYFATGGGEQLVAGPVAVQPGGTYEYVMSSPTQPGTVSVLRVGGTYRVVSDGRSSPTSTRRSRPRPTTTRRC